MSRAFVSIAHCNKTPVGLIVDFEPDCDVLVLLESLAEGYEDRITLRRAVCYPDARRWRGKINIDCNYGCLAVAMGRKCASFLPTLDPVRRRKFSCDFLRWPSRALGLFFVETSSSRLCSTPISDNPHHDH